ncbi:MAG TPA: hypothetical protein VLZ77_06260 [Acidimicrobiales bacterium]|nr:hypothetical protein [Acidimicrobiales bacterium]
MKKLITVAALAWDAPEEDVIAAMVDNLTEAYMAATEAEQGLRDRQLAKSRQRDRQARAHLPDYDEMDTLLRYKKSLENSSEKLLRQLETLQRARLGTLPAPLRVQGLEE